ncbi:MAG: Zn-ribbon domain-containing OB-fold protein [Promethearchaeota archaeon]
MSKPNKPPYVRKNTIHWNESNIDNYYEYTAGFAGSKFFHELKENGMIVASRCKKCNNVELPPKAFCVDCFDTEIEYVEVKPPGLIYTFSISYYDLDGSKLKKPIIWVLIVFNSVKGGIIHRLDEVEPEEVCIGMDVLPEFRPKEDRTGSILDIKYFKPTK